MIRCINLDWLEVYCLESFHNYPHDAAYFERCGYYVVPRPYGTRVFQEMFTLYDEFQNPLIEIRRAPMSDKDNNKGAFLEPMACHVRLHNRSCYFKNAAKYMQDFLDEHLFTFMRIKRVDICLDFELFDLGDLPARFVTRYIKGKYSKINQADLSAHGRDDWEERRWNSLSWGSKTSCVSTKFYNKTMEIREVKDKPYIRAAWVACGLIDDYFTMTKKGKDGIDYHPDIWRLEFSINSNVKGWALLETQAGGKKQPISVRNDLDVYRDDAQMIKLFASLTEHYFHFKRFEAGKTKYHCADKVLFRFDTSDTIYKVERTASAKPVPADVEVLIARLSAYRAKSVEPTVVKAIDQLLQLLQEKRVRAMLSNPYDQSELQFFRTLLAIRMNYHLEETVEESMQRVRALNAIEADIFGEQ